MFPKGRQACLEHSKHSATISPLDHHHLHTPPHRSEFHHNPQNLAYHIAWFAYKFIFSAFSSLLKVHFFKKIITACEYCRIPEVYFGELEVHLTYLNFYPIFSFPFLFLPNGPLTHTHKSTFLLPALPPILYECMYVFLGSSW